MKTPNKNKSPKKIKTPTVKTVKSPLSATPGNGTTKDKVETKVKNSAAKSGKENSKQVSENKESKTPKTTPTQKKGKLMSDNKQRSLSDFFKATPK